MATTGMGCQQMIVGSEKKNYEVVDVVVESIQIGVDEIWVIPAPE